MVGRAQKLYFILFYYKALIQSKQSGELFAQIVNCQKHCGRSITKITEKREKRKGLVEEQRVKRQHKKNEEKERKKNKGMKHTDILKNDKKVRKEERGEET